ncbi:MAG: T9SS type A sorting domain-containing protein, partial [Rhodothermia bacterium]
TFATTRYVVEFPQKPGMEQNSPNPFNPSTVIRYALPDQRFVRLSIYDALGRPVARLIDRVVPGGYHTVRWEAGSLPSGVYLYRLEAGDYVETRKMLLLR